MGDALASLYSDRDYGCIAVSGIAVDVGRFGLHSIMGRIANGAHCHPDPKSDGDGGGRHHFNDDTALFILAKIEITGHSSDRRDDNAASSVRSILENIRESVKDDVGVKEEVKNRLNDDIDECTYLLDLYLKNME